MSERMTADEARALLAGMTPGTLSVERAAGIRRLAVPQGDELALVIRDSPREFGGAVYSLEVCRGMDGPTREGNAAAFAAVKRALATVAASPDDTRAQAAAAGECDVAAIGARLHAIDREGVRSIDDALVMGAAITDPSTGDVEWILRHAPDVIDCLADAVRRFTAAAAADAFADRVRACHAAAARVERYTLPAEVLALIADVPVLLDALAREREAHAAEVAAAVAGERERDAADARHAALAGAVRAEREARSEREAALRAERAARVADASADMAGWQVAHDRYTAARVAHERASTHLTALLCGAPGGYVPARVVREYLAALDVLPGDLATINAACEREREARAALESALLAATTTPKESL